MAFVDAVVAKLVAPVLIFDAGAARADEVEEASEFVIDAYPD